MRKIKKMKLLYYFIDAYHRELKKAEMIGF